MPSPSMLTFLVLAAFLVLLGLAQPTSHRQDHASTSVYERAIKEYRSRLVLRDAVLKIFGHKQPDSVERRRDEDSISNDAQLSSKLSELNDAFQGLMQLLSSEYNVTSPWLASDAVAPLAAAASTSPSSTAFPAISSATDAPTSATVPEPSLATSSSYVFDPMSSSLNSVYYAQTSATSLVPLSEICSDPSIDIITLAFVTDFFSANGYPTLNLGPHCWAASAAQLAVGATGLIDCVSDGFAAQVSACQAQGKKVMLSLGGVISDTSIPNDEMAAELAHTIWDLFLGGNNETMTAIRPFGSDVVLDGIDIDNEDPSNSAHIPILVSTLRALFTTDPTGHAYYLSAAPQCPRPDASIPVARIIDNIDFLNVQFYNNPSCQLSSGQSFLDSLRAWSGDIQAGTRGERFNAINNGIEDGPRLLIGVPAWSGAGTGYVDPDAFREVLEQVRGLGLPNLGGAVYWDGTYEEQSAADGSESFAQIVREVLS